MSGEKTTMYIALLVVLMGAATARAPRSRPYLPHETDCDKHYLVDSKGRRHIMFCLSGTLFDYVSQRCMDAALAQCTLLSSITTAPESTTADLTTEEAITPTMTSDLPDYIEYLPNDCPVDPRFELLLPHEKDCHHFYKCSYGLRIMDVCPPSHLFSYEAQVCLNADEFDCSLANSLFLSARIRTISRAHNRGIAPRPTHTTTEVPLTTTDIAHTVTAS